MIRYLSLDWINAMSQEIAASEQMRIAAQTHRISVTQVVSGGPEGDITYHLAVGDGEAALAAGPADPTDVRMEQDWNTAVAVATGQLNAGTAFLEGHIRMVGDEQLLLASQAVFAALDAVFTRVAARTVYE